MNAISPIRPTSSCSAWDDATNAVNAWRGSVLHIFAEAEMAVSETLLALAQVPKRGSSIQLRRLVGQRLEDLRSAVAAQGAFGKEGLKVRTALEHFQTHDALRPALCHGKAKIGLDRNGDWFVAFRVLAFRGRQPERMTTAFEKRESEAVVRNLRRDTQRLVSALGQLRASLREE